MLRKYRDAVLGIYEQNVKVDISNMKVQEAKYAIIIDEVQELAKKPNLYDLV